MGNRLVLRDLTSTPDPAEPNDPPEPLVCTVTAPDGAHALPEVHHPADGVWFAYYDPPAPGVYQVEWEEPVAGSGVPRSRGTTAFLVT